MKLHLHIGTHKTASTSIQHFCARNADVLARHGFFYPASLYSAYEHNFLADWIAHDRMDEVAAFLSKAREDAAKQNCHTVVISAESFYAMTSFFLTPRVKKGSGKLVDFTREKSYWEQEAKLIRAFKESCAEFDEIKLACYVRPQDEFAFSIYNQLVKNVFGTSASFEDIVVRMREIFDYKRHLDLWADAFGASRLSVYSFNSCKKNILHHFCERYLTLTCLGEAPHSDFMSNTRLTRDVLEARRAYLEQGYDISEALVAARAFIRQCDFYPDKGDGDQIFGSLHFRQDLFGSFDSSNAEMAALYSFEPFKSFAPSAETYAGLSDQTKENILLKVREELNLPSRRAVIILKKLYRAMVTAFPSIKGWMQPVKAFAYHSKLKILGW